MGGNSVEHCYSLSQTNDGGYILGGISSSNISGDKTQASKGTTDYWLVKLDANGIKVWDKTIGGNQSDYLYTVVPTTDGGYILGGASQSDISGDKTQPSKGQNDYWVVKTDLNGNILWDKTIGGNSNDHLFNVFQTNDGGYILGGTSLSGASGDKSEASKGGSDHWIVKLDGAGNKQWDKTIGGNSSDNFGKLVYTSDGGYMVGGFSNSTISGDKTQAPKGDYDYWVVKLDVSGNKLWDKTIGGNSIDYLHDLVQTSDGGYILGGISTSGASGDKSVTSKGDEDYWIVKLDNTGSKQWDKTVGGNLTDFFRCLVQTSDGGFFLGGYSKSDLTGDKTESSKGGHDYWVIKLGPEILSTSETQPTFNLSISPNPNQGKFKLQLSNLKTATTEVTITDLLGRIVLQQQLPVTDQQISEELEIKGAKGMYILKVQAGNQSFTRKIVVE